MKAFSVNSKDLFDKKKNPKLSLSVKDILENDKIPKRYNCPHCGTETYEGDLNHWRAWDTNGGHCVK